MDRNLAILRQLFRFGMPAYLIILPLVMLHGLINPWPQAALLRSQYHGQTPVQVGFSYSSKSVGPLFDSDAPTRTTRNESRSYVMFPSLFLEPKIVSVLQHNDDPPITSESTIAFFSMLAWIAACFVGTWWFWIRPAGAAPDG